MDRAANNLRYTKSLRTGIDAMWGRADELALRFALVVACGRESDKPVIERADAEWACELVLFAFNRMILETDDNMADNEHELNVKRVLNEINKRHPGILPRWKIGKILVRALTVRNHTKGVK